jgi:phage-related protein
VAGSEATQRWRVLFYQDERGREPVNTRNNPRVLLCTATGRQIVLLHAFKKKGRRLPAKEVAIAKRRRDACLSRERKD